MENDLSKIRYHNLDALKFFAIIIICFHHYQQSTGVKFNEINFYFGRFYFGYLVELFFILSGFVIGLGSKNNPSISFKSFLGKRIIRLYPMCILSTLLVLVISIMRKVFLHDKINFGLWYWFCAFLNLRVKVILPNNPLWYISVLILCYIIYYCILFFSKKYNINENYFFLLVILLGIIIKNKNIQLSLFDSQCARGYICFFGGGLYSRRLIFHLINY